MNLREQLIRDEGVRYVPYKDSRGFWTNGVGHELPGPPDSLEPVTQTQVDQWLDDDIATVKRELGEFPWYQSLDEVRRGVFENMAFNLGTRGLLHFVHAIAETAKQNWVGVAVQMQSSLWAKEVGERSVRLASQIVTGEWT
jgi:lysozyme